MYRLETLHDVPPETQTLGATLASFLLAVSRFSFLAGRPSFRL